MSQHLLEIWYITQHLRAWIGVWPPYFKCKPIISYFRALEGRNTTPSCPFMPKLPVISPNGTARKGKICQKRPLLLWFLPTVRDPEVFHRCLTLLLSLNRYSWGLWVLQCYLRPGLTIKSAKNGLWFHSISQILLRTSKLFHGSLTFLLSFNGRNWGLWVLWWCPLGYNLCFNANNDPWLGSGTTIQRSHKC